MSKRNPFDGKGARTDFAWCIYERLMTREWFSHADVMVDYLNKGKKADNKLKSAEDLPFSISKCENGGELRKAFSDINALMKEKAGSDCIETDGNNRNKVFRYVGKDKDPLCDYHYNRVINDIRTYVQFCEDSAGFLPRVWLDHFFSETIDLLRITDRKKGDDQIISSSIDRELTNIELLPVIYEAIRDKRVLKLQYKSYNKETKSLVFHPHLLKEYNGRWFIFGHAEGENPEFGYNLALDRLVDEPGIMPVSEKYISAPKGYYAEFFRNIVGVSHTKDNQPKQITIRAISHKIFKLTETKKIHPSQVTTKEYGEYEDGKYGEFTLYVQPNDEFIGCVLQMGDGLAIVSPEEVKDLFRNRISNMLDLYL